MIEATRAAKPCTHEGKAAHSRSIWMAFALIVGLFFLWGAANNLNDILIKQFRSAFQLSLLQAGLVQSAFYLGYFLLAIPAGMWMRRFGFKSAILFGLILYAAGALLFYPAAAMHTYAVFLCGLFVIASGLSFLETSANPLVTVMGPPRGAAGRLNFAQAFNGIGSITGVFIGRNFIFNGVEHSQQELALMSPAARHAYFVGKSMAVQIPYLVIAGVVLVVAVMIAITRLPTEDAQSTAEETKGLKSAFALLRDRHLSTAIIAQFFYVGAQVGVWSYLIQYAQGTIPGMSAKQAANYLIASLVLFALGRFVGAGLMRFVVPRHLLAIFGGINVILCVVALSMPGMPGLMALVAVSFFMSIMYPTIFTLGVEGMSDARRKLASSFLVMAIIGGAAITALSAAVADAADIVQAEWVPLGCFVIVIAFAMQRGRVTDC